MFNLEGFIPKLCELAQEVGDDERALLLRSAGLQALSSMVMLLMPVAFWGYLYFPLLPFDFLLCFWPDKVHGWALTSFHGFWQSEHCIPVFIPSVCWMIPALTSSKGLHWIFKHSFYVFIYPKFSTTIWVLKFDVSLSWS